MNELEKIINDAWKNKEQISPSSEEPIINSINQIIDELDQGKIRVAEKINGEWVTHEWIKKAILMSFKVNDNSIFYLMSRGLSYQQSRELLINGFLLDVVEKITDSEIKNLIKNMIGIKE